MTNFLIPNLFNYFLSHDAGQFYFMNADFALANEIIFCEDSIPLILSREEVIDIDTMEDWNLATIQYRNLKEENLK